VFENRYAMRLDARDARETHAQRRDRAAFDRSRASRDARRIARAREW
jgi:hypothetical protein